MNANYPVNCWYVAASGEEVTRAPLGRTLLDRQVVLYRKHSGDVVALEDRCAHSGYPLSKGRVDGDRIVCGYHGCRYDADGNCVAIPSQPNPPTGAKVDAYTAVESGPFVWIWLGDPRLTKWYPLPSLPWLGDGWATTGTKVSVAANYMLVHEHYLDLTHIPEVHPDETPPGMDKLPPLDRIEVSEMSVTYSRELPLAVLADWEAEATRLPRDREYARHHYGKFVSPAVLVEGWDIDGSDDRSYKQVRIQALTPESSSKTHMFWRFGRNYALDDDRVGEHLHKVFENVMRTDIDIVETIEAVTGYERAASGFRVVADAGVMKVRRIIGDMLSRERAQGGTR